MSYNTSQELWKSLGESAYTKVRGEAIGTGSGSAQTFSLAHENVISGSATIYVNGVATTTGLSFDLDDGDLTFATAGTGSYTADYDYGKLPDSQIQSVLGQAEEELEARTGRKFNILTTSEYLDVELDSEGYTQKTFWLSNYPVLSTSVSTNAAGSLTDAPDWKGLTEGLGNDFLLEGDTENRMITFIDNFPLSGKKRIKVDYTHGYSTIPDLVKELEILLAQKKMINSGIYRSVVQGDNFSEAQLTQLDGRIQQLQSLLRKQNIEKI
jgi:hypothetical protein